MKSFESNPDNKKGGGFIKKAARIGLATLALGGVAKYGPEVKHTLDVQQQKYKQEHSHRAQAIIIKKKLVEKHRGVYARPFSPLGRIHPINNLGGHNEYYEIVLSVDDNVRNFDTAKPATKEQTVIVSKEEFEKYKEGEVLTITYQDGNNGIGQTTRTSIQIEATK
jgi:hypothetical protein